MKRITSVIKKTAAMGPSETLIFKGLRFKNGIDIGQKKTAIQLEAEKEWKKMMQGHKGQWLVPIIAQPCEWHKQRSLIYLFVDYLKHRIFRKGFEQKECPVCGRYFFKSEFGKPPKKKKNRHFKKKTPIWKLRK